MRKNNIKKTNANLKKLNEKMREPKAITLIALVITIVILLILAGVSIAMLTGENGLIAKAIAARDKTEEAKLDENIKLSSYENEISNYETRANGESMPVTPNKNNTMSGTEHFIGKYYFNGKPIYEKTIYIDSLPNATYKSYNHGAENVDSIWLDASISFVIWPNGNVAPIPCGNDPNSASILLCDLNKTSLSIETLSVNRSTLRAYVTINYTKTTDESNGNIITATQAN